MALGTGRLRMARETCRIAEPHDTGVDKDPGLLRITFGMVTRVAIVAHVVLLVGHMARCTAFAVAFKSGNRMVGFVPALRMWQLHAVTRGAEVRLNVTRRARLAAFAADNVGVSRGPGIGFGTTRMVAGIAVAACFPDLRGAVTIDTAGFSGFSECPYVLILVPAIWVWHLETVAGIAELLLLVAGCACGIRTREADAVPSGPIGLHMTRRSRDHGEGMA